MGDRGTSAGRAGGTSGESLAAVREAFGCGDALAETIAAMARESRMSRGAVLWPLAGRDETTLLTQGRAAELAYGREGAVLVLHAIAPGEFYGSLLGGAGEGATQVEAMSDGAGAHFSTATVLRLMEGYSCVALALARQMASRIEAMRRRMVESALLSATGRIAAELLRQANAAPDRTIRPMPVWAELAVQVQSTRETVSRAVSGWEKRGLVRRVEGGLQVVAPHRLEELVY
jgi:CRP-like cAMP-binding protein